jgi:hypothetical protein
MLSGFSIFSRNSFTGGISFAQLSEKGKRTVTMSSHTERRKLDKALVSFLETIDDGRSSTPNIDPADYPDVLPTTWAELTQKGLLRKGDTIGEMYELMPLGFLRALKTSGRADAHQFREKRGRPE